MEAIVARLGDAKIEAALAAGGELVVRERDSSLAPTLRALDIVRAFIIERDLILYGGLAIDYVLRAAGAPGIYSPTVLPDYDFYSTDPAGDADDLAARFVAAGYTEVRAVRAFHVTTSKVRAGGVWVADISWCPPALFARIPTVTFDGLRVRAPESQRIDQHLALSRPLSNPPQEDVFHRFAKDITRFGLLTDAYPPPAGKPPAAAVSVSATIPAAVRAEASLWALHGFAAYGLYQRAFGALLKAAGQAPPAGMLPALQVAVGSDGTLTADIPVVGVAGGAKSSKDSKTGRAPKLPTATLAGKTAAAIAPLEILFGGDAADLPARKRYAPVMDWRPQVWAPVEKGSSSAAAETLWVHLTADTRYAASRLKTAAGVEVLAVSLQYLAVGLLTSIFTAASERIADVYRAYYVDLLRMLDAADAIAASAAAPSSTAAKSKSRKKAVAPELLAPFAVFSGVVVGDESRSQSYWLNISFRLLSLGRPPVIDTATLPPGKAGQFGWGGKGQPRIEFDYDASPAFKIDGSVLPESAGAVKGGGDAPAGANDAAGASSAPGASGMPAGPEPVVLPIMGRARERDSCARDKCRETAKRSRLPRAAPSGNGSDAEEPLPVELAGLWHLMKGLRGHPDPDGVAAFAREFEDQAAAAFAERGVQFETEEAVRARQVAETGYAYATPDYVFPASGAPVVVRLDGNGAAVSEPLAWADAKSYPLHLAAECPDLAPGSLSAGALARLAKGLARQRAKYERHFGPGVFFGPAPAGAPEPYVVLDERELL